MIGMFDTDWRTSLPLAKIDRIVARNADKHGNRTYSLTMDDGEQADISEFSFSRIVSTPLQMIPASPGIEALAVGFDQDGHWINRTPVIAWARCFDGSIRIVTPAGVDDGHIWKEGQGYVLMPDGSVHSVGEYLDVTRFDSLDAYVAYESDQHQQRAEERALAEADA